MMYFLSLCLPCSKETPISLASLGDFFFRVHARFALFVRIDIIWVGLAGDILRRVMMKLETPQDNTDRRVLKRKKMEGIMAFSRPNQLRLQLHSWSPCMHICVHAASGKQPLKKRRNGSFSSPISLQDSFCFLFLFTRRLWDSILSSTSPRMVTNSLSNAARVATRSDKQHFTKHVMPRNHCFALVCLSVFGCVRQICCFVSATLLPSFQTWTGNVFAVALPCLLGELRSSRHFDGGLCRGCPSVIFHLSLVLFLNHTKSSL
ncbi:hypothetical protein TGMAS_225520 [Toxoplasma gondii MAS]|uniref:Uncharacterized protein n=1 Tax=Toxoplasma gondii MAS TaxID=943118 RepID=A0A086QMX7_TOXGO|nr:hypothetical protein TGMAS_225520 [Toxoplasma gondii MAS]